jgi:hypothetical protein
MQRARRVALVGQPTTAIYPIGESGGGGVVAFLHFFFLLLSLLLLCSFGSVEMVSADLPVVI